jgi:hypothetical protein
MSRTALIAAGIYLAAAMTILILDAMQPPSGGWITLKNMVPFLVTFPVSAPLAMIGIEPDLGNKLTVGLLVAACAGLIYKVVALIAGFFTSR